MGASDLHFEPEENFIRCRYRLDGDLVTVHTLHKEYWNGVCQRLKIMSEMNIADKLTPQDGRFNLNIGGREADFRVSAIAHRARREHRSARPRQERVDRAAGTPGLQRATT